MTLATQQNNGTQNTVQAMIDFLNYCATHPDAVLRYMASDMVLQVHSDATYLVDPEAHSRTGGHHFLGNHSDNACSIHSGAILAFSKTLRMVVASAAEAEVAVLFHNAQEAVPLRTTLIELGHHQQPATPLRWHHQWYRQTTTVNSH
jgi:hypothetical protein